MTDEYLRRSVRAISTLQFLVSFLVLGGGTLALVLLAPAEALSLRCAGMLVIAGTAAFSFMLARGLRNYRPWARTATMIVSCIALLAFPFGAAIFGPFLYVLVKAKNLFAHDPQPLRSGRPPVWCRHV